MPKPRINLIPLPQSLTPREGHWTLDPAGAISAGGPGAREVAELLAEYLRPPTGYALPIESGARGSIHLQANEASTPDDAGFVPEDYRLAVSPDKGVRIDAVNATGLARGIQTLRQLFPASVFSPNPKRKTEWTLSACEIDDRPRFRWRGQHLDVSRHFFTVEQVCRFIDLLALHRLNVCHLHLTDDQGWRIDIPRYPRLTQVGAWREQTLVGHERERPRRYDGIRYGGFYTRDDLRRLVAYATRRHIAIIPEIDMPGHMAAAIAAYPELGNFGIPSSVRCHWGTSQRVLNVEESTVEFMCHVLDEAMSIFPSRFIHIGGDEAPRLEWSESARAQVRMATLGLTSEDELQSWFICRIGAHLNAAGRRCIGWDEILDGELAPGTAVMNWRDETCGVKAAAQGLDVVMAPHQRLYFDHYQANPITEEPLAIGGMTQTELVYAYDPIPAAMKPDHRARVLGSQGQLWTEYISSVEQLDYMGFPRICALAEVLWLDADRRNYRGFLARLAAHRERFAALGINAHPRP